MAIQGQLYHVGIVVPDVEAAMAHFTDLLGITWGPVVETEAFPVREGDGTDRIVPNKLCYSTEPPHLELVQEVPGTVWECNEHSNLHHIGVWTDALPADSATYTELRCPLQLCGRDDDGALVQFAYHRDPLGVRIELVDIAVKPTMEEFMFTAPEGTA
jgi:catechol 2,3-dioxygenase-like lactoylglutathione lyase family enzyme